MRIVAQRVSYAEVEVEGRVVGGIGLGLLLLLGVARGDTRAEAEYLLGKVLGLRVFEDEAGKMNRDVRQVNGSLLVVSQFTLLGDISRGLRPSFDRAAPPDLAEELYQYFVESASSRGIRVETGIFRSHMNVKSCNYGPVTILIDSEKVR